MKKDKIFYWISTGIVSAMMLISAFMYLSKSPDLLAGFKILGYPLYFITLLGTAKLLAAIALVVPGFQKIKEWAYAGLTFTFLGAIWSHLSTGTPFIAPLVILVILGVSYWFRGKLDNL